MKPEYDPTSPHILRPLHRTSHRCLTSVMKPEYDALGEEQRSALFARLHTRTHTHAHAHTHTHAHAHAHTHTQAHTHAHAHRWVHGRHLSALNPEEAMRMTYMSCEGHHGPRATYNLQLTTYNLQLTTYNL